MLLSLLSHVQNMQSSLYRFSVSANKFKQLPAEMSWFILVHVVCFLYYVVF